MAKRAQESTLKLQSLSENDRQKALINISQMLLTHQHRILSENQKDIEEAKKNKLSSSLIDRLKISSVDDLVKTCLSIAKQPPVLGEILEQYQRPNGLVIQKQSIPIGVIAMIFESRPNVVVDATCLAIKSGNALILKGGKEAKFTNRILFNLIQQGIQSILPPDSFHMIESRESVLDILKLHEYIDLVVPRGGHELIKYVRQHASMPVIAHDKGLCHLYLHQDFPVDQAKKIILNSKVSRPGVCNALESLLIHKDFPNIKDILLSLHQESVEIRGCSYSHSLLPSTVRRAQESDYETEFLDKIISVKIVSNVEEAISHIQLHGSKHTESLLAKDDKVIEKFQKNIDASAVVINASTRFNDGGELGLGAELGISTSKLHAYGPMGAREMTATRTLIIGDGQIRK